MAKFDYGAYFGPITPLADTLRDSPTRFWEPSPEQLRQPHEYVLYLGCNVLRTVHLAEAIVAVLKALGVDFVTLGGPSNCCGIVHHRNGDAAVSARLTGGTLGKFTQARPKAVLMYCPSCHSHLDKVLPEGEFGFDVPYFHVTEFIAARLGQLKFTHPLKRRIGLHAHEGLPQQRRDSDHTRAILGAIPGLEVVDLPAGEAWGLACIPVQIAAVGAARHAALVAEMFASARAQGCDGIAAVYHSCYRELLPREAEFGLEWLNYIELLAQSLGLGPFPARYKALKLAHDPAAALAELAPRARDRGVAPGALRRTVQAHFAPGPAKAADAERK
jgi:Fe-S oxidoreductase